MSARIREQIEQLKENDMLRRELISNISHDLRTPLAAMQGYVENLNIKGDSLPAGERDRYLRVARRHTVRLSALIGELFELSKLDSASVTPQLEAFSIAELIQDTAQEFQLDAERKGNSLKLDVASASKMTIGDIGLIQRVLENLVRNAIKFTPGGGEVTVSIAETPFLARGSRFRYGARHSETRSTADLRSILPIDAGRGSALRFRRTRPSDRQAPFSICTTAALR